MKISKKIRKTILVIIPFFFLIVVALLIGNNGKHSDTKHTSADVIHSGFPPQAAVAVVTKFIQMRENMDGANQSSISSWLSTVESFVTPGLLANLTPDSKVNSGTGTIPASFKISHANHFIVKANVSKCVWNRDAAIPTSMSGAISCAVYDVTQDQISGNSVIGSDLPFGWDYSGQQTNATLSVVKQGSVWLVSNDLTGTGG